MTKLIGLSGSLRQRSFNSSLLRVAVALMPQGAEMTIGSIRDIPLYDGDLEEAQGVPGPAQALKDAIAATDRLLLVTPEYHNSIPGVFKNAIGRHRRARDSDVLDRFIQQAVMQVLHRLDGSLRRQVQ